MMRIIALCALVVAASACQSDRGCVRGVEYCAKLDNLDGTQTTGGECKPRPQFGERCGSSRLGLTKKCADKRYSCTSSEVGCCGSCSTTRATTAAASSTRASSTRASTAAASSTARASTTAATTTIATSTGTTRQFHKNIPLVEGRQGYYCNDVYARHITDSPWNQFPRSGSEQRVLKGGAFKITGVESCDFKGRCVAKCEGFEGLQFKGLVKIQCKPKGWVIKAKKCNYRKGRKLY